MKEKLDEIKKFRRLLDEIHKTKSTVYVPVKTPLSSSSPLNPLVERDKSNIK